MPVSTFPAKATQRSGMHPLSHSSLRRVCPIQFLTPLVRSLNCFAISSGLVIHAGDTLVDYGISCLHFSLFLLPMHALGFIRFSLFHLSAFTNPVLVHGLSPFCLISDADLIIDFCVFFNKMQVSFFKFPAFSPPEQHCQCQTCAIVKPDRQSNQLVTLA